MSIPSLRSNGVPSTGAQNRFLMASPLRMNKRFNRRRALAWLLIAAFFVTFLPFHPGAGHGVHAAETRTVTLTNVYEGFARTERRITVEDQQLGTLTDKTMSLFVLGQGIKILPGAEGTAIQFSGPFADATIPLDWEVLSVTIEGTDGGGNTVSITYGNITENVPEISSVETPVVNVDEAVIINGPAGPTGIQSLKTGYQVRVGGVQASVFISTDPGYDFLSDSQAALVPTEGNFPGGVQSISVQRLTIRNTNVPPYTLSNVFFYRNAVRITVPLNLDGIQMFPTVGDPGSRIQFTRSTLEPTGYDVYFISDLSDPDFSDANRSPSTSVVNRPDADDILNATVPTIPSGPYYMVFTNPNSQIVGINRSYTLMSPLFRVVQVSQIPSLDSIQPATAPSMTPTDLSLFGNFLLELNVENLILDNPDQRTLSYPGGNTRILRVDYGEGTFQVGEETYRVNVTRDIEVNIGFDMNFTMDDDQLTALENQEEGAITEFTFTTTQSEREEPLVTDVRLRMTTNIAGELFTGSLFRELILEDGFTYLPSSIPPFVDTVQPDIIPIVRDGLNDYLNPSMVELTVTVKGENFLVTRYIDEGEERVSYPRVRIGGVDIHTLLDDPNNVVTNVRVLSEGQLVDGTEGNDIGDTLQFTLRAGSDGFLVANRDSRSITITNPRLGSGQYAAPRTFENRLRFELVGDNDFPVIEEVDPSLVSLEGGVPITIRGSNLLAGAQVFIDGMEVANVNVAGDTETITFTAPPARRSGEVQLHVINPGENNQRGIATHPFTYTTTFTQPNLASISPQEGTQETLVTARGANFLNMDPTVVVPDVEIISEFLMYRLIGTRIQMDGRDINQYHRDASNRIQLTRYHENFGGITTGLSLADNVFRLNATDGSIETGAGFNSVILVEPRIASPDKFYRILRDVQNQYQIQDGLGGNYIISRQEANWLAQRAGTTYNMEFPAKGVIQLRTAGGDLYRTLYAWTPFRTDLVGGVHTITGNRVQYINSGTLEFSVPNLERSPWVGQGLYDVSVINPDTRRSTLANAFFYFADPLVIPRVIDVQPDRGPEQGGNQILIIGPDDGLSSTGFLETGTSKTKVFIGAQQVPEQDVVVSPNGREISLRVPAFYESIREQGTNRVTVPLVLVNPGGGTFSINFDNPIVREVDGEEEQLIRGYTYVVPRSTPVIERIDPARGSAAGGFLVDIFGFEFRDTLLPDDEEGDPIPALPDVYFGTQKARILEMSPQFIQVVAPPGTGTVPVYVMNADAGISNTMNFEYIASNPAITTINPDRGDRRGGTLVEILGQNFETSPIQLLTDAYEDNSPSVREELDLALVRVGQRTNKNLPRENENSGRISASRATVRLAGGVTIRYNALEGGSLDITIEDRGTYTHEYKEFDVGETVYINTGHLTDDEGENYPYEELIRFWISDNRLLVEGGYAPRVDYRNNRHLVAEMPAYFTTGTVPLTVVNPDGGTATANFVYITPDSRPVILNVTREGRDPILETREGYGDDPIRIQQVSHRGGNVITVEGTDFRPDARITIGNVVNLGPDAITENLGTPEGDRLTFTMPSLPENTVGNLYRLVVTNQDGGSATSDQARDQDGDVVPLYFEIIKGESDPRLDTVTPNKGPVTGGTRIALTGNDFRRVMEGFETNPLNVFFGEARVEDGSGDLEVVDFRRINVTAPASDIFGPVNIRVENPDGELSLPPREFIYISQPDIDTIEPARIFANDSERDVTVTGSMFMNGARVILGGRLVPKGQEPDGETVHGDGIRGVDEDGNNREFSVVGGIPASSVTVQDQNVMVLNFPEALDLETTDLIIINPDGGLSDPFADFDYAIPVPDKPLVLEAIPGAEGTVHLIWSKSAPEVLNAADSYEIYGRRSTERQYRYLGNTGDADFRVRGLELDTRYDFMVRALNRYGAAIEFAEASARTLSAREDPKLSEKLDELDRQQGEQETRGREEIAGTRVLRTVGSREIPAGTTPYVIDFSGANYTRQNDFVVAFPVSALSGMTRPVRITDGSGNLTITPRHLLTRDVANLTASQRQDAVVQVHFTRMEGQDATGITSALTRTQSRASAPYRVDYSLKAGRSETSLPRLLGNASMTINLDSGTYRNATSANTSFMAYDPARHRFTTVTSPAVSRDPGIYLLVTNR